MQRTESCLAKVERMDKALRHETPNHVSLNNFFWDSFLKRRREDLGLAVDTDIYRYYDPDSG